MGAAQSGDGAPTVTEDEDGNVTIVPNWEAKAQCAHPVERATEANMGGAGGGMLDLEDGVYLGDHPGEETPAPTPKATAAPTPAPTPVATPVPTKKPDGETQTPGNGEQETASPTPSPTDAPDPAPPSGGSTLPPDDGSRYNGEISPDGNYGWVKGFGWVERGEGSYGIPGQGTHTTDGGEVVGSM